MEIRNCIYRGGLNNLIKRLAKLPEFIESVNQKNLEKRMNDRSLVLRFLAFYERTYHKAQGGVKVFFNEFCETYKNPPEHKLIEFEREFKKAMKASLTIFGHHAFRIRRQDVKGGSEWAAQVNASVFQLVAVSFTNYELSQLTRKADQIFEEYLDLVSTDANWVDYVTKATGDSLRIKYTFQTWNERLAKVMEHSQPNDSSRLFSKALKMELFNQDKTCAICKQEIKMVNDAALDHHVHYWRGGKTIPSNARLVHRLCNLQRPN